MCIFISIYQELFNKEDSIINPILQMRKLRHRAVIYPRSKLPNATFYHFSHKRPHHRHLSSCMCCSEPGKGSPQNKPHVPPSQRCVTSLLHAAWEPWQCQETSVLPEDGLVKDFAICRCWQCIWNTHCNRTDMTLNPALLHDGMATLSGAVSLISRSSVSLLLGPAQS